MLLRPNGVFFLIIPLIIILINKTMRNLAILMLALNLISTSYLNYIIKDKFTFFDFERLISTIDTQKSEALNQIVLHNGKEEKIDMYKNYIHNFYNSSNIYYFNVVSENNTLLKQNLNYDFENENFHLHNVKAYNYFITNDLQKYIFKNNDFKDIDDCFYNFECGIQSKLIALCNYAVLLIDFLKIKLILLFFFIVYCIKLLLNFNLKPKVSFNFFVLFYFINLILLPFMNFRFLARYIYPYEIFIYISSFYFIFNFIIPKFKCYIIKRLQ